jgi:hypothetical protein
MKHKFETYEYISNTGIQIALSHVNNDNAFDYFNSIRLKKHLKPYDQLTILEGEDHNDFATNNQYINDLKIILNK